MGEHPNNKNINTFNFKVKVDYINPFKIYIKYCQTLDFDSFPNILMKTLIIKINKNKLVRWNPNKKPPGSNLFLLIGG